MRNIPETRIPLSQNIKFLTPTTDADKNGTYLSALTKAIDEEGVTNIAISGPYGSGKSSVIKTYMSKQENKNEYIQISLANFEEKEGDDIDQKIEKSILQQIFYKVEKSQVPYSKLKRIVHPESWMLTNLILFIMGSGILTYLVFTPKYLILLFGTDCIEFVGWLITALFLGVTFVTLRYLAGYLSQIKLEKIVIKDATFNLGGENDNGSLINRHLDEILYFFEVTNYKYLILEDLDRYNNVKIYEKLRELNTLINNYDKVKAKKTKVVFIYAIKDDLFVGENRSKFFDIIIPIVPYINATGNARDLLVRDLRNAGITEGAVSEQLLKDISKFIHDRRLLTNIINEFLIYANELNPSLGRCEINPEKLFCMIVYKNFFPSDFADLHQSKGWLYDVFNKKKRVLQANLINQIDINIQNVHDAILGAEHEVLSSQIELRGAMLHKALGGFEATTRTINVGSNFQTLLQIASIPRTFESFIEGGSFLTEISNNSNRATIQIPSLKDEYQKRLEYIRDKNNVKMLDLKKELTSLRSKRSVLFGMNVASMLKQIQTHNLFDDFSVLFKSAGYSDIDIMKKLESPIILTYFLREEKISEDYPLYISYYHEGGSLSRSDNNFIINVIEGQIQDIHSAIDDPILVIDELSESKFLTPAILNITLIGTLFSDQNKYKKHCDLIYVLLEDTHLAKQFIPSYISSNAIGIPEFFKYFATRNDSFWRQLQNYHLIHEELFSALGYMLESCDIETILAQGQSLLSFIFGSGDLLFSKPNAKQNEILIELLPKLNGKLSSATKPVGTNGEELLETVIEHNLYELNSDMVSLLLKALGGQAFAESVSDIHVAEYSNIKNSNIQKLITYVEENIDAYVRDIFLLTLNDEEFPESYISICCLIDHEALDRTLKLEIIQNMATVIHEMGDIAYNNEIWSALFRETKVSPFWENVVSYYMRMGLTTTLNDALSKYLSNNVVAESLSISKLNDIKNCDDCDDCDDCDQIIFSKALIFNDTITLELLKIYHSSIDPFDDISNIGDVPYQKLVDTYNAGFIKVTKANYQYVRTYAKEQGTNLHIDMIESNFAEALEMVLSEEFDIMDTFHILSNSRIPMTERYKYLSNLYFDLINISSLTEIITHILYSFINDDSITFDYKLFKLACSKSSISIDNKIEFFLKQVHQLSNGQIYSFLTDLGGNYADLMPSEEGKSKFNFSKNKMNKKLFQILHEKKLIGKVTPEDDDIEVYKNKIMR